MQLAEIVRLISKIFFLKFSTNVKKLPKLDFDRDMRVHIGCPKLEPPFQDEILGDFHIFRPFRDIFRAYKKKVKVDAK